MRARNVGIGLLAMLILGWGAGCGHSAPTPAQAAPAGTVARVHWLGMQRLARESNAAYFMSVWNLPASKQVMAEALDKLAMGLVASNGVPAVSNPLPVTGAHPPVTNHPPRLTGPALLLRPLLDDVLQQECFFEAREASNQPAELALAIRLNEEHAGQWETNLAAVLKALTGDTAVAAPGGSFGWQMPITGGLSRAQPPVPAHARRLELTRAGEWTLVGLGPEHNALLGEVRSRIRRDGIPFARTATNFWVEVDLDLGRLAGVLNAGQASPAAPPTASIAGGQAGTPALLSWPDSLPKLAVTVIGTGGEVRTVGELKFAKPLPFEEQAWNIPTNLIHQKLISFTAIRGFGPWLSSQKAWKELELGAVPNQVCFWAREGLPFLSYGAVPLPDASNCVARLTERLTKEGNAWLATNGMGKFLRSEKTDGLELSVPFMEPYLESATVEGSDFVIGGLLPYPPGTNSLAPPELYHEVTYRTNLVCYDWELTGLRMNSWLYIGQLLRMDFFRDRLAPESPSIRWFEAAAPKLGNCATAVLRTGPDRLTFLRRSAIGFNSVELHLLADWLESPSFPRGYSSQVAHRIVPPVRMRPGTNSVPMPRPKQAVRSSNR